MKHLLLAVLVSLGVLGGAGCSGSGAAGRGSDVITVEGRVSVRGHAPFTVLMLETDQRTVYVLKVDAAMRRAMQPGLPATYRVTGILTAEEWNGHLFTHLRPLSIERP